MAIAIIEYPHGISVYTTLKGELGVGAIDGAALVTNLTLTEKVGEKGAYRTTTTAGLTGLHWFRAYEGSTHRGCGYVWMTDEANVHIVVGYPNVADRLGGITNLDVAVSSRMATFAYTAPDNATIGTTATAVNAIGVIVTAIQAILSGITNLGNWLRLLARKGFSNATALGEINTGGATAFVETTDSLEALRDRGDVAWITGVPGGSGAHAITITVNDGVTALQNAIVRFSQGAETYSQNTNVSGVCAFSLDAATWSVAITKAGYQFTPTTLIVSGTVGQTYSMTLIVVMPSAAGQTTGYLTCYSESGVIESGVSVLCRLKSMPVGSTGLVGDVTERTQVSAGSGLVQFTGMIPGATYELKRGTWDHWQIQKVPIDAGETTELESIKGAP